ncbi:ORF1a [Actinidia yellowing ringspot virus]|uniref:Replication protein 1a n=1 Tax=Actinidia yellowing ringspot virus TaxID=2715794 RepID=A0A858XF40_9BROM|nr:ORF1a [Actinidia yellowing ringspot virus]
MDLQILDLLKSALSSSSSREDTTVGKIIADHGASIVRNALGEVDNNSRPLEVSFVLTSEQQALLKAHFPNRVVKFSNKSSSQHSFAAAHRVLETDYVYSFFPEDATVIDIGGNFANHVRNRRNNVHSCCPILDVRDGARYTERFMSLSKYMNKHPNLPCEPLYCKRKFQDCGLKADYAMAIHSLSDIPLKDLCATLLERNIKKCVATIMMVPEMLVDDEGTIPHFDVRWKIDRPNDRIYFDFEYASNLGYDHCYSTLLSYMRYNAVRIGDSAFRVERTMDWHGVIVVDITYAEQWNPSIPLIGGRSCAWFSKLKNKVVLKLLQSSLVPWAFTKREIVVDKKTISRVLESAFRQYSPDQPVEKAIQNISTLLSSGTNHVIINGVSVIAGTPLDEEDFVDVATTIYYITKCRYNGLRKKLGALRELEVVTSNSVQRGDATKPVSGLAKMILPSGSTVYNGPSTHAFSSNTRNLPVDHVLPTIGEMVQALIGRDDDFDGSSGHVVDHWARFVSNIGEVITGSLDINLSLTRKPLEFIPLDEYIIAKVGAFNTICVEDDFIKRKSIVNEKAEKEKADEERLKKAILTIASVIESGKDITLPKGITGNSFVVNTLDKPNVEVCDANLHVGEIDECIDYLASIEDNTNRKFKGLFEQTRNGSWISQCIFYGNKDLEVYIPRTGVWKRHDDAKKPVRYSIGKVYDGKITVMYGDDGKFDAATLREFARYDAIFFDQSCVVDNISVIRQSLIESKGLPCGPNVVIVDGVAGCGKTTKIVDCVDLNEAGGVLVLTSNANSSLELREKISGSALVKSRCIRTIDSYLMMKKKFKANKLFIDEGFMQHSGCIYAALAFSGATDCYVFGDSEQIPFISRNPLFILRHQMITGAKTLTCLDTFRSPMDATKILNDSFYKKKRPVKTLSKVTRSISLHPITSNNQIPSENALYLCYTQAEKAELLDTLQLKGRKILTVHEAQGESVDNVIFCRLSRTSTELTTGKHPINGSCHALVALSRHKKTFKFYSKACTVDTGDILYNACSRTFTEKELLSHFTISERAKMVL